MGKFTSLLKELMGPPDYTPMVRKILTQKGPSKLLAKAIGNMASLRKSQDVILKSMPPTPTVEDHRRTFNRVSAAIDAGIAEGRLSGTEVARLEVQLNNFASRHRL